MQGRNLENYTWANLGKIKYVSIFLSNHKTFFSVEYGYEYCLRIEFFAYASLWYKQRKTQDCSSRHKNKKHFSERWFDLLYWWLWSCCEVRIHKNTHFCLRFLPKCFSNDFTGFAGLKVRQSQKQMKLLLPKFSQKNGQNSLFWVMLFCYQNSSDLMW